MRPTLLHQTQETRNRHTIHDSERLLAKQTGNKERKERQVLTGCDENHISTSQSLLDIGQRFLGSGLPHLGLSPCTKAASDARPERNLHLKRVEGINTNMPTATLDKEGGETEGAFSGRQRHRGGGVFGSVRASVALNILVLVWRGGHTKGSNKPWSPVSYS